MSFSEFLQHGPSMQGSVLGLEETFFVHEPSQQVHGSPGLAFGGGGHLIVGGGGTGRAPFNNSAPLVAGGFGM